VTAARVRVVRARPRLGAAILLVRVHDADNRTIGTTNQEERARHDDEDGPRNHALPPPVAVGSVPVIVQPHAAHGLEAHEGAQKRTDERDEAAEDGDGGGDDVREQRDTSGVAEPGNPVLGGGGAKVLCAAQSADEEVLGDELCWSVHCPQEQGRGTYMGDQDDRGEQTWKREAVAHLLHQDTCGTQRGRRDVRSAVVVHDNADGDVDRGHDELAERQGLEVVLVVLHLGHDVEVGGNTAESEDDAGQSSRSLGEGRRLEQLKVRLPGAELRRRRGTILDADGDGEGDDCGR
jgi:hypothetical protein